MYTFHVVPDVADELSQCNFTMRVALNGTIYRSFWLY